MLWLALWWAGLPAPQCWTAAITSLCAVWWITEPIPIPATSMIPFALLPFAGVLSHRDLATAYGHTLILLFLGGFLLSAAMERSGAHRRLAVAMVRTLGRGGGRRLVLGFMIATAVLSMWISNTATALMMLPIAVAVIRSADERDAASLAPPLLLGIAYGASIGGLGTPVGTPPNVVFLSVYAEHTGREIDFLGWMKIGVPVTVVMLPIAWLWITRRLRGIGHLSMPAPGAWTKAEVRVAIVFVITAMAWMTRRYWSSRLGLEEVGDSTVALLAAVGLFLIPDGDDGRLLDWPAAQRIPWGLLLLFGGGIAIAKAFTVSGLSETLGEFMRVLATWPTLAMVLCICLAVTFLTEITSNTATTTMLMPILAAAALAAGIEPAALMVPAALSASCAFMLPVATPPNAVIMGAGYLTIRHMTREGLVLNLVGALVISLLCLLLVGQGAFR